MAKIQKGTLVKYIGQEDIMQGQIFYVWKKSEDSVYIYRPVERVDGIKYIKSKMPITDFVRA